MCWRVTDHTGPRVTIDAGLLGTGTGGHGHADALSVQVAVNGREWLSDPGTGAYIDDAGDRDRFRATRAHNTVEVDGRSQAEPAGPFAWRDLPAVRVERYTAGETFDLPCRESHRLSAPRTAGLAPPVGLHAEIPVLFRLR